MHIGRCRRCRFVFATNSDEIDMTNRRFVNWRPDPHNVPTLGHFAWDRVRLEYLRAYLPPKARVLDYGAGFGIFLKAANDQGYKVEGVNPCRFAADCVEKNFGILVHPVFGLDFHTDHRYHLIFSDQTFEHLIEPMEDLKHIVSLLHSDGIVYIEVPNWHHIRRWIHGVDSLKFYGHYNYFTPFSLARMCQFAGLKVLKLSPAIDQFNWRRMLKRIVNASGLGQCIVVAKKVHPNVAKNSAY